MRSSSATRARTASGRSGPRRSSALSVSATNASRITGVRRLAAARRTTGTSAWPGKPTSTTSAGVSCTARASTGARWANPRGSVAVTTVAPTAFERLAHDPVAGVLGVEVPDVQHPQASQRGGRHRRARLPAAHAILLRWSRRRVPSCTRCAPSCSPSAAASPATACARRSTCWARYVPLVVHEVPVGHPGPRLDGARASGTSATPTSPTPDGRAGRSTSARSNLHVVGYSAPVDARMPAGRAARAPALAARPSRRRPLPHLVLRRDLGLLPRPRRPARLPEDATGTRSCIDATLEPGSLTYGECLIPGRRRATRCSLSTHVCHPSLANDNLSGIALLAFLGGRSLARAATCATRTGCCSSPAPSARSSGWRATRRPSTGSATAWWSPGSATPAPFTYKRSRRGDADDRPGRRARAPAPAPATPPRRRLLPLRLRRAAVLLARLRPSGRAPRALAARRVPRVPHVGRRPRRSCGPEQLARRARRRARGRRRRSRATAAT